MAQIELVITLRRSRAGSPSRIGRPSVGLLLAAALLAGCAPDEDRGAPAAESTTRVERTRVERAPCDERHPLRAPFFGDLHVHTAFSLDASTQGTRNRPADAYRFAQGDPLGIQPYTEAGEPMRRVKLARPLDFAAVTDHAELIGEWNICNTPGLEGHDSTVCRVYRRWPRIAYFWMNTQAARGVRHDFCGDGAVHCLNAARAPWDEILEAAEDAYDRSAACRFTTFPAYEWTGAAGVGTNYHRNVIFRNAAVPPLPISFIDEPTVEGLWSALAAQCTEAGTGCDVAVIPHNSNLGAGRMFQTTRSDGSPLTAEDARMRARYEPLAEVMQHKGDSECFPGMGFEDELCGFEKLATASFVSRYVPMLADPPVPRMFLRRVLAEGLEIEARLGANPFRYGLVASTDTHLGTPGLVAERADYPGHGGAGTPAGDALPAGLPDVYDFNPGGLAVLYAEENSRDSLFDAIERREAYGTSGPRIVVRFFGGFGFAESLCDSHDLVATGYAQGVPMGGRLPAHGDAEAPAFIVSALRDPGAPDQKSVPLQRVQIVKGWLREGTLHERVFEVAGDRDSRAGVDLRSCEPHGTGFDSLCAVWRDPDFAADDRAFYYARVVQNPTCRWSQRVCNAKGVRCDDPATIGEGLEPCCAEDHRAAIQERAWTSPIWYAPADRAP